MATRVSANLLVMKTLKRSTKVSMKPSRPDKVCSAGAGLGTKLAAVKTWAAAARAAWPKTRTKALARTRLVAD